MVDRGPSEERGVAGHREPKLMDMEMGQTTWRAVDHQRREVRPDTWSFSP